MSRGSRTRFPGPRDTGPCRERVRPSRSLQPIVYRAKNQRHLLLMALNPRAIEVWTVKQARSHLRQLILPAPRAVAPGVGLGVGGEFPLLRVPFQLAMVPVSKVHQVADRHASRADLDVGDRLLAALDAFHPVQVMIAVGRFAKMDSIV